MNSSTAARIGAASNLTAMKKPFFFQVAVKNFKAAPAGDGATEVVKISGLASTPGIDRYGDIVEPEAFAKAIDRYMTNPVLLRSHDSDRPAGVVTKIGIQSGVGLPIEADVMDAQSQQEIKDGRLGAFSIGYIPLVTELQWMQEDGTLREFNWETDSPWSKNAIRVIKELDLVEISLVTCPANPEALFTLAKSLKAANSKLTVKDFKLMHKDADAAAEGAETTTETADAAKAAEASTGTEAPAKAEGEAAKDAAATGEEAGTTGADADAGAAGTGEQAASADTGADGAGAGSSAAAADTETGADEGKDAEEETTTEGAGEGGIAPKPEDDAEKAAETAAAVSTDTEAAAAGAGSEAGAGADGEGKRVVFPRDAVEAAKAIEPILKELGIVAEGTAEGAAVKLPDEVKDLMVGLLMHVVELNAKLDEAEGKLAKIPQKQALAPAGQAEAGAEGGKKLKLFDMLGIPSGRPNEAK